MKYYLLVVALALLLLSFAVSTFSSPTCCSKGAYRSFDGSNTRTDFPNAGAANTAYGRLIKQDIMNTPCPPVTMGKSGQPLPNARYISLKVFPDKNVTDPVWTFLFMSFAQFMVHDSALASGSLGPPVCCTSDGQVTPDGKNNPRCFIIPIAEDDPKRKEIPNFTCMGLTRTLTDDYCQPLNAVSHFIDLSQIYGLSEEQNTQLREGKCGRLLESEGGYLPTGTGCPSSCPQSSCYLAGDTRVNQNPELTIIHTLFLREHNRIANELAKHNPSWDDEKLFQTARQILIAMVQKIVYKDYLPGLLGNSIVIENSFNDSIGDCGCDNSPAVTYVEYATGGSRVLHSSIPGYLQKINSKGLVTQTLRLKENFFCPANMSAEEDFCELTNGLVKQPQMLIDVNHAKDITEYLFGNKDLKVSDILRGREQHLSTYNKIRKYCGLPEAVNFTDFGDVMPPNAVAQLDAIYACPDDVDAVVGMQLEKPYLDGLVGPTARCIIKKQYQSFGKGDPFFWENDCSGFSELQKLEIKKATIAGIICNNDGCGDETSIQPDAFRLPNSLTNKIDLCKYIPQPDLSKWKDE